MKNRSLQTLALISATSFGRAVMGQTADGAAAGETSVDAGFSGVDPADMGAKTMNTLSNLLDLAIQGGWFMIPIAIASVVTLVFTLERVYTLRRGRNLPRRLIRQLRNLMTEPRLDPRKLWEACQGNRSPLANVVRAVVLKVGRPQAELERAAEDAVGRETEAMTRNLRPINVVASIAPLLGLLGTVQGMIMAFMVTSTTTSSGTAKAQELAHGIYTALVTTFAGLCVAVVSVVLANFLEGRIEALLRRMEALFLDLLPQLERYEGRMRILESNDPSDGGIRIRQIQNAPVQSGFAAHEAASEGDLTSDHSRRRGADVSTHATRIRKAKVRTVSGDATVLPQPLPSNQIPGSDTLRANFDS